MNLSFRLFLISLIIAYQESVVEDVSGGTSENGIEWDYHNAIDFIDPKLLFLDQTIESLMDKSLWLNLCPFLSIGSK